ncbi:hypothetical protein BH10BAC3_BH10BAC3_19580 [soil metagenome]
MPTSIESWCKGTIALFLIFVIPNLSIAQEEVLQSELNISSGLPSNTVRVLKLDSHDKLWVGTDNGLIILNDQPKLYGELVNTIGNQSVWAINFLDTIAFIGTRYNGLILANILTGKILKYFPSSIVSEIRKIKCVGHEVFILTNQGLWKWSGSNLRKVPIFIEQTSDFLIDIFEWENKIYGITYPSSKIETYNGKEFYKTNFLGFIYSLNKFTIFSSYVYKDKLILGSSNEAKYSIIIIDKNKIVNGYKLFKSFGIGTVLWQIALVNDIVIVAAGDTHNNRNGALYTTSQNSAELNASNQDYVTCFEIDSLKNIIYYGTLNKGLFVRRFSYSAISEKSLYRPELMGKKLWNTMNKFVPKSERHLDNFLSIGDTALAIYPYYIHLINTRNRKTISVIKRDKSFDFAYVLDAKIYKKKLYTFDSYGHVSTYDFRTRKKQSIDSIVTFLPYAQDFDDNLIFLNREKGFNIINQTESFPLSCVDRDISFITDYTCHDSKIYTLSNRYLKKYEVNLQSKSIRLIDSSSLNNLVAGFIPKWIDFYNGNIVLLNNQGLLLYDEKTKTPEKYYYYGNFNNIVKPIFVNGFLELTSNLQIDRIPMSLISEKMEKDSATDLGIQPPRSVSEDIYFSVIVHSPSYLIENHFLKQLKLYRDGKLLDTKYIIGNSFYFENGLKYGTYDMVIRVGEMVRTISLPVSIPLNRNPLFFGAVLFSALAIAALILKGILDRKALNRKLLENRINVLKQNLNPHFVYNSMNLISSLILEGKYDEAIEVVSDFSQLQRNYLETNSKPLINLNEELNFLNTYLKLQQKRFYLDTDFNYRIKIDRQIDLDKVFVPPLILQPIAENAIKYGILGSSSKKKNILIDIKQANHIIIGIEDNGDCAFINGISLGIGQKTVTERAKLFEATHKRRIEVHFKVAPVYFSKGYRVEFYIF